MNFKTRLALALGGALGLALAASAQQHSHDMHEHNMHQQGMAAPPPGDARPVVKFPEELRLHTLANMRDHLLALQEIQDALAKPDYDNAADIAEQRLGMTSLKLHGAHEVAKFMPESMQNIGQEMHRAASRFAVAAKDAAATGDARPVLAAMARVTQQCVACHASYRVQ